MGGCPNPGSGVQGGAAQGDHTIEGQDSGQQELVCSQTNHDHLVPRRRHSTDIACHRPCGTGQCIESSISVWASTDEAVNRFPHQS